MFQPIGALASGDVVAFEALIRGPAQSPLESPAALFGLAELEGSRVRLERFAAHVSLTAFSQAGVPGKLFVNLSADAIREIAAGRDEMLGCLHALQLDPERIVIELTEQADAGDLSTLVSAVSFLRESGMQLALDDYGSGNANLSLWIGLMPDYVKIDRSIINGAGKSPFRFEVLRYLGQLAESSGAQLVAEGLENIEDLMVCRDLGIDYGQGFLLGKPHRVLAGRLEETALAAIHDKAITVFPDAAQGAPRAFSASKLVVHAPTLPAAATSNDAL